MRHVYLLRHAKSSWDDPGLPDHERGLAPRGVRDAKRMAGHLRDGNVAPELVICSSARRTVDTLEPLRPVLPRATILIEDSVYAAPESQLLERLRRIPDEVGSALLIGHNPGLQDLAAALSGRGDRGLRQRLESRFPTAALATLAIGDGGWSSLEVGAAELVGFVTPKELA
ncbi:MAG TPA: histidine phosphatase family protein [Candidatus Binatia bacterium]|nr:histidine phosphatase family protein [Candidatus Binatia bacterium]